MTEQTGKWVLSLSKNDKLMFLEDMLKEQKYGMAFEFMDVLLKAPISKGGITTDEINKVWKKYFK